jgi:basic membrane lipoprotein Med (substrate-binding protein (PBP1-ABC) superfamily)
MRMRAALIGLVLLTAGCGGTPRPAITVEQKAAPAPLGLRVGVVGGLSVSRIPGARFTFGPLRTMPALPLVLVSADDVALPALLDVAARYPTSHYAYVGGSTRGNHRANVVGIVFREEQAARLGGYVAGLVALDQGGVDPRVAWVGPEERALANAFVRGVHEAAPAVTVLRAWSRSTPASCKEAALGALGRGAVAIMSHGGLCADAALTGAHQQNDVGLRLSDFELVDVPIGIVVRDAVNGVYRGGEDLVFGAASGAIGVRRLDPRVPADIGVQARAAAQQLASGLGLSG